MLQLKEDEAMAEVRAWKKECNDSVAHLPIDEALQKRLEDSEATARSLGFFDPNREPRRLPKMWDTVELMQSIETNADNT